MKPAEEAPAVKEEEEREEKAEEERMPIAGGGDTAPPATTNPVKREDAVADGDGKEATATTVVVVKTEVPNGEVAVKKEPGTGSGGEEGEKDGEKKPPEDSKDKKELVKPLPKKRAPPRRKDPNVFLQCGSCHEVHCKMGRCRECRASERTKDKTSIFCRFYAFRKLRRTGRGGLNAAGFSEPGDASKDDLQMWLPQPGSVQEPRLDVEMSKYILASTGNQFCQVVEQEKQAQSWSNGTKAAWKRVVQGVREMCDVCMTTLFNFHWVCFRCGFVVCLDCYRTRMKDTESKEASDAPPASVVTSFTKDRDEYNWLICNYKDKIWHNEKQMMFTQIIPADALWKVRKLVHKVRSKWKIPENCPCSQGSKKKSTQPERGGYKEDMLKNISMRLADGAKKERVVVKTETAADPPSSAIGSLLLPTHEQNQAKPVTGLAAVLPSMSGFSGAPCGLDAVLASVIQQSLLPSAKGSKARARPPPISPFALSPTSKLPLQTSNALKPVKRTMMETKLLYPDVPHTVLCDGRLLRLHDPTNPANMKLFQDQWKRGQPVVVSGNHKLLNRDLWEPASFTRDFGDVKNDLINCKTGATITDYPMKRFWDGFEKLTKRTIKDDNGESILLKLKDWPPGEDFFTLLPDRFEDLMCHIPIPQYTRRDGCFNLCSRLPEIFVRPDLGPKMYNAYGSAMFPSEGTTNLHLDISDAVNVMVYVGIPDDDPLHDHREEAIRAVEHADADIFMRARLRDKDEVPGALWHIFAAEDADKIRQLLRKPSHLILTTTCASIDSFVRDASWRNVVIISRLRPLQVRNLHSCIKVAEDFVSPEGIGHCFALTQEFRELSDTHTNHEDKLQIKNIIYHSIKDAVSVLLHEEESKGGSVPAKV
ncbi:PREDICTED: LOW QUALITY PROTEIN: lysine-specific demethylase 3B-like [Priapulus caudatus]|uniref:LOW QUALITY PROTEIN: lysine-specific demethylase 3B-like n=1 Tax=Priapulus caudatus TaxID=37621 RepID=A0ABM1E1G6_PRICU|nr:PREDICTED: LOW QUALITY PROTEIN: lysine-specific demethylase 3B-like [Priapulus caudatus]